MDLYRLDGWEKRLADTLELHYRSKFLWGLWDCTTLFRDCTIAISGVNVLSDAPSWDDERSGYLALRALGYKTVRDLIDDRYEGMPVSEMQRGDLAYPVEGSNSHRLMGPAVCLGLSLGSRNPEGFVVLPASSAVSAYRMPKCLF